MGHAPRRHLEVRQRLHGHFYPGVNRWITFDFQPPEFDMTLTWRTTETRARFRGDQVIAMVNFGTDLTFFDPID